MPDMRDVYNPYPMRQNFAVGTRILVAGTCAGWREDCRGVVCAGPEIVQTIQGEDYFYWVLFDIPQHDLSSDGPYYKAQVLSRCLIAEPNT